MYPIASVVAVVAVTGWALPSPWSQLALVVLPLPALTEFVGEHRRWWLYAPTRHAWLSALQGLGLGVGFGRYLLRPADPWFWGVGVLYSAIALAAALTAPRSPAPVDADRASEDEQGRDHLR